MKVVSFIPIKLNNQRLPGKNTMMLNGRPMCDYLFETISEVDTIDEKYGGMDNFLTGQLAVTEAERSRLREKYTCLN